MPARLILLDVVDYYLNLSAFNQKQVLFNQNIEKTENGKYLQVENFV